MKKEDVENGPRLRHLDIEEATRDTPNFKNTIRDLHDWLALDLTEQIKPLMKLITQVSAAQTAYYDLKQQLLFKVSDLANHIMATPPSQQFLGEREFISSSGGETQPSSKPGYPLAVKSIMSTLMEIDNFNRMNVRKNNNKYPHKNSIHPFICVIFRMKKCSNPFWRR